MKRMTLVAMATVMLLGCSAGPSEDEISAILMEQFEAANNMAGMLGSYGEQMKTELVSLTNHGCDDHETMDGAYTCDVEATIKSGMTGEQTNRSQISLAQSKEGKWYFVQ